MKIAIDGFALGLSEGTGLATFAYETAHTLHAGGHEVSVIYGLQGLGRDERLRWPRLVERLRSGGEMRPFEWLRWLPYAAAYALPGLLGWPLKATPVCRGPLDQVAQDAPRIPEVTHLYNLPGIYPAAHALAGLTGHAQTLERLPGAEVFHRTSPLPMRMRGVANVVTVHDVIPLAMPDSTAINLKHYRRIMQASLAKADALFVISEHSRRDLLTFFDIPAERVVVVYQAVDLPAALRNLGRDELRQALKSRFDLAPGGYFLFYGAIEPKKNVMRILDAHGMSRAGLPLVIAGRNGWMYEPEVRRIGELLGDPRTAGRLRRYEYLPFEQLMLLLKGARALVFPSLYEGFGLPVLEAMLMGVPVITSNTTSLPEVAGDAALMVDPRDAGQIADAMDRLAGDDALCAGLVRKGQLQVQKFKPELYGQRLESGYRRALG
jgi:glycosyltransferase involved in cell wall biosynthesis